MFIRPPRFRMSSCLGLLAGAAAIFYSAGFFSDAASAAEQVGKSVRVVNNVNASIGNRQLAPTDPVFITEQISAALQSHGEILLNDNSKVIVGENSVVSLDDFVVGSRGFESGTFKVAKGAFRLVTGNSKKNSMRVETPLATIGARGTIFDVYVGLGGLTRVILFEGAVEVCSSNNCVVTEDRCDVVEVTAGLAQEISYLRSGSRSEEDDAFDLTTEQQRFQRGWRAPTTVCDVKAAFDPQVQSKRRKEKPSRSYEPGNDNDNSKDRGQRSGEEYNGEEGEEGQESCGTNC